MLTKKVILNSGIEMEAYTMIENDFGTEINVGFFPDGSGVVIKEEGLSGVRELSLTPEDVDKLSTLLRYAKNRAYNIKFKGLIPKELRET